MKQYVNLPCSYQSLSVSIFLEFTHTDKARTCLDNEWINLPNYQKCIDAVFYAKSFNSQVIPSNVLSSFSKSNHQYSNDALGSNAFMLNTNNKRRNV